MWIWKNIKEEDDKRKAAKASTHERLKATSAQLIKEFHLDEYFNKLDKSTVKQLYFCNFFFLFFNLCCLLSICCIGYWLIFHNDELNLLCQQGSL